MNTPGIIGGLGPATTAEFYMELIRRARRRYSAAYPRILVYSVPVPFDLEQEIVLHGRGMERIYPLLEEAAGVLQASGADFLALPCNTVHQFHRRLQGELSVPLLNLLDITAARCASYGFKQVAVLGTRRTLESGLYTPALERHGLRPVPLEQGEIDDCAGLIYRLLQKGGEEGDRQRFLERIAVLAGRGAEAVILGCTDLQLLVRPGDAELPIPAVDSVDALLEETVRRIGEDGRQ